MNQASSGVDRVPIRTIEPSTHFRPMKEIREIWRHRELLYLLAWRDYKVRYRQTLIGLLWAVLQPVLTTVAFVLVFGRTSIATGTGIPYPLYVFSGMVVWQFFANSVSESSKSLVASSQMITKIYFPRILIPLAKIGTQLIDLLPSMIILLLMIAYYHLPFPLLGLILSLLLLLLLIISSAGVGVILSAVNVRYRDVQFVVPFFVQLGLFLSPVIYAITNLGWYKKFILINPATGIIDTFRAAMFGLTFPVRPFGIACIIAAGLSFVGLYYFSRTEGSFSDVI